LIERVERPTKHIIGHIGDGFYRSNDPTNSVKALKEEVEETSKKDMMVLCYRRYGKVLVYPERMYMSEQVEKVK